MKHIFSSFAALLLFGAIAGAKVQMPSVFSDNMVLQRQTEVALWGSASGKSVKISASWAPGKDVTVPVKHGKWTARLATPAAGGPYELKVSDGEELVFKNILIGEVWFCSGQSNMTMPMRGYISQPVEGGGEAIMSARPSVPIRMCSVKHRPSVVEEEDCQCSWKENTPENVAVTSAVAWFFAKRLQESLDIPIGILNADWGGTLIESWMSRDVLESQFGDEFDLSFMDSGKVPEFKPHRKPCTLFCGMVAPLIPYTFRGMIWYQGEANSKRPQQYTRLQPAYVKMMRDLFQNPDAPFYFVQIAPYSYKDPQSCTRAYLREAQEKTLKLIPNSGMAATIDLGVEGELHSSRKKEIGDRLAYLALVDTYGVKGFNPHSPSYKSVRFDGSEAIVTFNVTKLGLAPLGRDLPGFEVAGEDRVFHPATARVQDANTVKVVSEEVSKPVAVRYCFRNWIVGALYNAYGIPALPFRTDDWDTPEE